MRREMEMEMEEMEAVMERIWDLHDKISDAIHTVTRAHFLHTLKSLAKSGANAAEEGPFISSGTGAFGFAKGFRSDTEDGAAMAEEARSLDAIRAALENLEEQLEYFHTIESQQQVERAAVIAKLEQSRIFLAMRLADHQGKKYKVIEEALAFVGNVHDKDCFITPEALYEMPMSQSGNDSGEQEEKRSRDFIQMVMSSLCLAKRCFRLEHIGGILGNSVIFAASMIAFLRFHQFKSGTRAMLDQLPYKRSGGTLCISDNSKMRHLDVLSARG
ncbi:plastid division protein PDV1-like [Canna indica]|uniref:Plastid division protein PDV1-like n=1 Tax=Canna indica TaxID=4628 RepID=A0AAQ3K586_9LILI|nr:plastid division protein PDV1-like [Canna indica]